MPPRCAKAAAACAAAAAAAVFAAALPLQTQAAAPPRRACYSFGPRGSEACVAVASPARPRQVLGVGAARTGSSQLAALVRRAAHGAVTGDAAAMRCGAPLPCGSEELHFFTHPALFRRGLAYYDGAFAVGDNYSDPHGAPLPDGAFLFEKVPACMRSLARSRVCAPTTRLLTHDTHTTI